jgi:hypothetical protein
MHVEIGMGAGDFLDTLQWPGGINDGVKLAMNLADCKHIGIRSGAGNSYTQ